RLRRTSRSWPRHHRARQSVDHRRWREAARALDRTSPKSEDPSIRLAGYEWWCQSLRIYLTPRRHAHEAFVPAQFPPLREIVSTIIAHSASFLLILNQWSTDSLPWPSNASVSSPAR